MSSPPKPSTFASLIVVITRLRKPSHRGISVNTPVDEIDYNRTSSTPGKYWLFAEVSKEFGVEIDPFAVHKIATVGDLVRVLNNHGRWPEAGDVVGGDFTLSVHPATIEDLSALRALKTDALELDRVHAARLLAAPDLIRILVAVDGASIVGCCTLVRMSIWNAKSANARNMCVAPWRDDDTAIAGALYHAAAEIAQGEWGCPNVRRS